MTDPVIPEGGNAGFTPPATQEEFNAIIAARLERERGKFAGFDELKAKAERLDEIEEQGRSDLEKAEARAAAAEQALKDREAAEAVAKAEADAAAELAKDAAAIAEASGVPVDLLRGSTKDELEAHAKLLAPRLTGGPVLNHVRTSGTGGGQSATSSFAAGRERAKARTK